MSQASVHAKLTPTGARQGLVGVSAEKNLIPKVDKDGIIQGVAVPDATTVTKGKVLLAVLSGIVPGTVVQANDSRLTPAGIDHGGLGGIGDDDHPQYPLLVGRAAGQILVGGTAATDALLLRATADAGAGPVVFEVSPGVEAARILSTGELVIGTGALFGTELLRVAGDGRVDGVLVVIDRLQGSNAPSGALILEATSDVTPGPVILRGEPGTEYARFEEITGALLIGVGVLAGSELLRVAGRAQIDTDLIANAGVKGGLNPGDELLLRATEDVGTPGRIRFEKDGTGAEYGRFVPDNGGALLLGATAVVGSENLRVAGVSLFEGDIGFYSAPPVAQSAAYTQSFASADRTHAARTAATVTDSTAGTPTTTVGPLTDPADTPASADALRDDLVANIIPELRDAISSLADQINKLQADQVDTAELVNSLLDDFQLNGLLA